MARSFRGKFPYIGRASPFMMAPVGKVEIYLVSWADQGRRRIIHTHWQIEGYTGGYRKRHKDQIMW